MHQVMRNAEILQNAKMLNENCLIGKMLKRGFIGWVDRPESLLVSFSTQFYGSYLLQIHLAFGKLALYAELTDDIFTYYSISTD